MLQIKRSELKQLAQNKLGNDSIESQNKILVMISVSLAARTSYTIVGDEKEINYQRMIDLHDKLIELNHRSPLEHCAKAMSNKEYETFIKGELTLEKVTQNFQHYKMDREDRRNIGWCNNFKGFIQYRYLIENEL